MLLAFLALFTSCAKRVDFKPVLTKELYAAADSGISPVIENLGAPFRTTNVAWKINPLNPNNQVLFTYHPNSNSGYEVVMIDNGISNSNTPVNAFRFVSVNIDNRSYKIIKIVNAATGAEVTNSVGRVVRYVFGKNKKLYVATEGSYGGGGHIIEYDPNTQTAWDLGKPFYLHGKYLDIYSLNTGSDGTLYGGSFGGSGEVMTFRYNYSGQIDVDKTTLDNESRYVSYISGDADYTYASCGENNWYLYAIEKATGHKKLLLSNNGSAYRIEMNTYTDAPYAKLVNTHYQLKDGNIISLGANNRPPSDILAYTIYPLSITSSFNVRWSSFDKKLYYTVAGNENQVQIYDIVDDTHRSGAAVWVNNKLFTGSANFPLLGSYDDQNKWKVSGNTGVDVYSMAAAGNTADKIYVGAYPKGSLLEYNTQQPWNLDGENFNSYSFQQLQNTNPKLLAREQNTDAAGNNGPMYLSGVAVTSNNFIVSAGDNDRITSSSGRELAISTVKNSQVTNLSLPEFSQYRFSGMCMKSDSNTVIIAASSIGGAPGKIYTYNPSANTLINSKNFPTSNPGQIVLYDKNTIAGTYDDVVYLWDINSGRIVWQQTLGGGQRIYAISKTPDNGICVIHLYLQAVHFKILKFNFTITGSTYTATSTSLGEITDADNDESSKPQTLTFGISAGQSNLYDLYITGLKSIYRIKYCLKS